jgi:hypothetical protein
VGVGERLVSGKPFSSHRHASNHGCDFFLSPNPSNLKVWCVRWHHFVRSWISFAHHFDKRDFMDSLRLKSKHLYAVVLTAVTALFAGAPAAQADVIYVDRTSAPTNGVFSVIQAPQYEVALALSFGRTISAIDAFVSGFVQAYGFNRQGERYLGLKFLNEVTGVSNYGWLKVFSGSLPGGFPASI